MRTTTSVEGHRDHVATRIFFADAEADEYEQNIQIADLNMLNAALAVIKWKKLFGPGGMKLAPSSHEFVELMPQTLEQGTLYVSTPYATAIHLCACGCGIKVVTPTSPPEWHLTWGGDAVSLYPSIGNWQSPCSHDWIRRNRVIWAGHA